MCCDHGDTLDLPPPVIEMLARYRRLHDRQGFGWGEQALPDMFRWARFSLVGPVSEAAAASGDWPGAVRDVIGPDVPAGIVVVRVDDTDAVTVRVGPARPTVAGTAVPIDVVVDSAAGRPVTVTVAGEPVTVAAGGAGIATIDAVGPFDVVAGGHRLTVDGAVTVHPAATLRLSAPHCARWSVTDPTGGAWFPTGLPPKWDATHRPYFHARAALLTVPTGRYAVSCGRGLEYERVHREVTAGAGAGEVACAPRRLVDPAADGWYGGDLHVHLNYSGDLVCTPDDAARMQAGEGLHLLNLVAGNFTGTRVYDRELLEEYAGTDLPWSGPDRVARMGVEYRNDLLGHVHALGPAAAPSSYHAGHEGSDRPWDWPPNETACRELRALGATVGYAHPTRSTFPDGDLDAFFGYPRSVEARELVVDAALGVVDSLDVLSPFDDEGAIVLYHRLLSCGLRLTATAGSDVFLSFAHGPDVASNPPGWCRVYADLRGAPLTVAAFQDAVRAGRTVVTNGPWVTLDVDGHGPGAVLDVRAGARLRARATVTGTPVDELSLVGPDGQLATAAGGGPAEVELSVDRPLWIAAVARGGPHPLSANDPLLAHTTPVYVDVAGRRVARADDAAWCLAFLDRLDAFVAEHGRFAPDEHDRQAGDLAALIARARDFYRGVAASST
jgi:hypothetical protein